LPHTLEHTHHDLRAEHGQTLAEYAILAGGIAVMVAVTLPFIAGAVTGLFESAARAFGG
jgi:Flp pilus assembly pilin Flp